MLRFFRTIRRRLWSESQLGKYFAYAVGEILLIVIGIYIALQLGNWNEDQKAHLQEQKILLDLKNELETNLERLDFVLSKKNEIIRNGKLILKHTGTDTRWDRAENFDSLLVKTVVSGWVFNPETGVLTDILSSGKLILIKDDKLRNIIASLDAYTKTLQNEDEVVKQDLHNMYLPFISKYYPIRNTNGFQSAGLPLEERELQDTGPSDFGASPEALLNNLEFENNLNIQLLWVNFSIFHYRFQRSKYVEALEIIDHELKNS